MLDLSEENNYGQIAQPGFSSSACVSEAALDLGDSSYFSWDNPGGSMLWSAKSFDHMVISHQLTCIC